MRLHDQISPLIRQLNTPHPDRDEERRLIAAYKNGCQEAYTELVERNIGLVRQQANRFWRHGLDINDLIQEGFEGLHRALEKFDLSRGRRLSTYAVPWIYQKMQRYVAENTGSLRRPVYVHEQAARMFWHYRRFEADNNRPPTDEEMAEVLDCTVEHYRLVWRASQQAISLEEPIGENGDSTLADMVVDGKEGGVEAEVVRGVDMERIERLLGQLSSREERILRLRFGLTVEREPLTLQQIAERFGLTRERIRQIEAEALGRLRGMV